MNTRPIPLTVKPPPEFRQPDLFTMVPDKAIAPTGEARTRYGRVVEEAVCGLMGLTGIPNSGSYDCVFDAYHFRSGSFCEIKSLKRGNKLPIYECRRHKDAVSGKNPVYVIGIHRCPSLPALGDVWKRMSETLDRVLVLPAAIVNDLAAGENLRRIRQTVTASGKRNGYQRHGYKDGYRNIPYDRLMEECGYFDRIVSAEIHGLRFRAIASFHPEVMSWN